MNFCAKMIHNTFYKMFTLLYTVKILYILYIYDLFHILLSFSRTYESRNVYIKTQEQLQRT
jgi:hypothetical protein